MNSLSDSIPIVPNSYFVCIFTVCDSTYGLARMCSPGSVMCVDLEPVHPVTN